MKTQLFVLMLCALSLGIVACDSPEENVSGNNDVVNPTNAYFSVGERTKVSFAPGNLQYQPSTKKFRFAAHQYDTIGVSNALISETYNGWIDLFAWGSGDNPTKRFESDDYSIFVDWGTNIIGNNKANTYRTLTAEEWNYLFYKRPSAPSLWGRITVNGTRGIILFPDDYITNTGFYEKCGIYFPLANREYNYLNISAHQWDVLESYGLVFLPYTSTRIENKYYTDAEEKYYCFYWTSSKDMPDDQYFGFTFWESEDNEYGKGKAKFDFHEGYPWVRSYDWGGYGEAVRLVKDIK